MEQVETEVFVDCDAGRRMGCGTFCCRLLVRYAPDEDVRDAEGRRKGCVDKDPETGLCVFLDRSTERCGIWASRPRTCRLYDCNADPLLQIVLRNGFRSLAEVVRAPMPPGPPLRVPTRPRDG